MNIGLLGVIIVTLVSIFLLVYYFFKYKKKAVAAKYFLLVIIFINAWTICNYFLYNTGGNIALANVFNGLAFTFGFLSIYFAYLFANTYPRTSDLIQNHKKVRILTYGAFLIAFLSALPIVAGSVFIDDFGNQRVTDPPLIIVFVGLVCALLLLIFIRYLKLLRTTKGAERAQVYFMMITFSATIIGAIIISIILPLTNTALTYQVFLPISAILICTIVIFAITRKGVFDLRPVIAKFLTQFLAISTMILIFLVIAIIGSSKLLKVDFNSAEFIFYALVLAFLASIYWPVKKYYESYAQKYYYYDGYDPQKLINQINQIIINNDSVKIQLYKITKAINNALRLEYIDFYIYSNNFNLHTYNKTFNPNQWKNLRVRLNKSPESIFINQKAQEETEISKLQNQLNINTVLKLLSQDQNIGYMVVGSKRSGNLMTSTDIEVLEIIANEIAIAVQNNLRFLEIANFNETLQKEVNSATYELKKSNEKLKSLDEAKDKFINMASHQLRTPLTSIKGYLAMVLDGDMGDVNDMQKNALNQAFINSQRMAYVVGDLLNLSRIKTGKFVMEYKPTNLADVVKSEVEVMKRVAELKNINLIFKMPSEFLVLNLDENKLRQTIVNFIDNAIHYTPENGDITVKLVKRLRTIEFTVTDTGIGVPKAEQHQLFSQFYRASNARKNRPDGTGIGLYMAKKVVVAHGGAIIFNSQEGKGSTFGFSLPLNIHQT